MGRSPCCSKEGLKRGAWTALEDKILTDYIQIHGEGKWRNLPKRAGLKRCGKSCRLRWLNYLRPDIKRGNISSDEEELIIRLHKLIGNRWSLIAGRLPGRTDNEIKNYWNTKIGKKIQSPHPSSTSLCTSSGDQSQKNLIQPSKESMCDPQKPTTNASCLVRTKAIKCCDQILMTPPAMPTDVELTDETVDGERMIGTLPEFVNDENIELDFMMDFEIDEQFLFDVLNVDFSPKSSPYSNEASSYLLPQVNKHSAGY